MHSTNKVKEILKNRAPRLFNNMRSDRVHAAVLIPLFMKDNEYHILFTERTHKVKYHKGEVSFPGGVVEEQDSGPEQTALRESYEEIGLLSKDVQVLGRVDDVHTAMSNFIVHPFVGTIPYPYSFEINKEEVESIINVPLQVFLEINTNPGDNSLDIEGFSYSGVVYEYDGKTIWGATARIMENFIEIIRGN